MNLGKTIQIFIPDGNPRSIKIADITSRTIQAILIPRSNLEYATTRDELNNVGIYFLIGDADDETKPILYIGEAEDCQLRLKQQNKTKDFWNTALAITSKTNYFTKTHVKFLEWFCYSEADKARRYRIDNPTVPTKPFVSEPMESDLLDNFETIKILVSTLGYPIFDPIKKPGGKDILICKGKDAYAEGEYTEDGLVIFKESKCNLTVTRTLGSSVRILRKKLIGSGILIQDGNVYKFTDNQTFSSPSAAAATVLGRSANGWIEWKYKNGKTLDEVKRKSI